MAKKKREQILDRKLKLIGVDLMQSVANYRWVLEHIREKKLRYMGPGEHFGEGHLPEGEEKLINAYIAKGEVPTDEDERIKYYMAKGEIPTDEDERIKYYQAVTDAYFKELDKIPLKVEKEVDGKRVVEEVETGKFFRDQKQEIMGILDTLKQWELANDFDKTHAEFEVAIGQYVRHEKASAAQLDNAVMVHKSTMRDIFGDLGASLAADFAPRKRKKVQPALPAGKRTLELPPATLKLPEDAVDWEEPEKAGPPVKALPPAKEPVPEPTRKEGYPKFPPKGEGPELKPGTFPKIMGKRKLKKEHPK
ncbi:hypothetical protein ACFLQ2_01780 [archaeon]